MLSKLNADIKKWIDILSDLDRHRLDLFEQNLLNKRIQWFEDNKEVVHKLIGDDLEKAYQLLLMKLEITKEEAPIIKKTNDKIIFHSMNFCPSLEACKILLLDTRVICKSLLERPTDALIKRINPRLTFTRNYRNIRPYTPYCEEIVLLE